MSTTCATSRYYVQQLAASWLRFGVAALLLAVAATVQAQTRYTVQGDGVVLDVREFGTGSPVVILAGGPGLFVDYLQPVWEKLSENHRCIVLQQRGIGLSKLDALTEETLRLDHYLADLEALRRHLQLPRMTILGHSWGGMLELLYASRYPQHVAKLVLLDSGGPTAKFFDYFGDNIRMRLREEDRELMKQAKTGGDHLRAITPGYYYDRDLGVKSRAGFPDEWLVEGLNPIVMKQYGELGDQIVKGLKRYHGPVELIQGRQDPIGESTVYEIKAALPQTKIHFIERTGHLPWTESQESIDTLYKLLEDALK